MAEYLPRRVAARKIFCRYSPRLKRIIVLVYTHEVISKQYFQKVKGNFIESNLTSQLCVKHVQNYLQILLTWIDTSKWSFYTVQIGNFNGKSAWKSITDQTKFSKLSRKACCLARCKGACQWRLELR